MNPLCVWHETLVLHRMSFIVWKEATKGIFIQRVRPCRSRTQTTCCNKIIPFDPILICWWCLNYIPKCICNNISSQIRERFLASQCDERKLAVNDALQLGIREEVVSYLTYTHGVSNAHVVTFDALLVGPFHTPEDPFISIRLIKAARGRACVLVDGKIVLPDVVKHGFQVAEQQYYARECNEW
jgi:hypothetical protein